MIMTERRIPSNAFSCNHTLIFIYILIIFRLVFCFQNISTIISKLIDLFKCNFFTFTDFKVNIF